MASFKHKALHCYPYVPPVDAHSIRPGALPFRSRDSERQASNQHVIWPDSHSSRNHNSNSTDGFSSAAGRESVKGHMKSWLDSSPTSVIEQARSETHPPTPSPICSPSPSSPISSPCRSIRTRGAPSLELLALRSVRNGADGASNSNRHGKEASFELAPPESPTGSTLSSGSDGSLLALLASKLFSYRETHRSSSRYAREKSYTIDDKHVMEDDRGSKPPVEEIFVEAHPQSQWTISDYTHRRAPSETLSEISLGSANGRSLSMEFDAMLAAAAATGVEHATALDTQGRGGVVEVPAERLQLPGIVEDHSLGSSFGEDRPGTSYREENGQSMVRIADRPVIDGRMPDAEHFHIAAAAATASPVANNALALTRQGANVQDSNLSRSRRTEADTEIISELSPSSRSSSSGSRRTEPETEIVSSLPQSSRSSSRGSGRAEPESGNGTMVPYASPSSGRGNRDSLAIVLVSDKSSEASSSSGPSLSVAPDPRRMALEKVRRDKIFAKALAYQDAKTSKFNNRYKREEAKIIAWENQQRIEATVNMKKVEMRLEEKRARAFEKMQNEIALAHKKAEDKKAIAEAIRGAKTAKVVEVAEHIKRTGKLSSRCLPF